MRERVFPDGVVIFHEGQSADGAYLLEEGQVHLSRGGELLRVVSPGSLFGEMAALDGAPREVTARAVGDTVLTWISSDYLQKRISGTDPVVQHVIQVLLRSVRAPVSPPEPAMTAAVAKMRLERQLTQAIQNNNLHLRYQPIVDLEHGHVCGAEALLRWNHPVLGPISPAEFVLLAEETHLILELDRWAISRACEDIAATPGMAERFVSINLSAREVGLDSVINFLIETCSRTGVRPAQLKLEVTERAIASSPRAKEWVERCVRLGFKVLLDDFGTGYSNLAHVLRLPISTLKLDQTFVTDVATNPRAAAVIKAIVAMAHAIGADVVAEGIETEPTALALSALGCQLGQGYLFARPLSVDAFARLLTQDPVMTTPGSG